MRTSAGHAYGAVGVSDVLGCEVVFRESRILPRGRDSDRPRMYRAGERWQVYGCWLSDTFRSEGDEEFVCLLRAPGAHLLVPWSYVERDAELAA